MLLCPAWKKWSSARTVKPGTIILHSRGDDVIPFGESLELVRASGLLGSTLIPSWRSPVFVRGAKTGAVVPAPRRRSGS